MATMDDEARRPREAGERKPPRDEAARARAYLDLWERHLIHSAVDGPSPILSGHRPPQ